MRGTAGEQWSSNCSGCDDPSCSCKPPSERKPKDPLEGITFNARVRPTRSRPAAEDPAKRRECYMGCGRIVPFPVSICVRCHEELRT